MPLSFSFPPCRWDELEEVSTAYKALGHLQDLSLGCYTVKDLNLPATAPGNLADDQGNPFEHFGEYQKCYVPLGLAGVFTICGIDTAANSYPNTTEVALDKQGKPLTLIVTPDMSAFDILAAVVAISDAAFDGPDSFPHHCYPEGLDIDLGAAQLHFSMGS